MKQTLMVVATKSCSDSTKLTPICFTFQTCLKNPIPCIPSPKTSNCVRFSVGGQLWFLQTISASSSSVVSSVVSSESPLRWHDGPAADGELARTLLLLKQRHLDTLA
ncbi:hypothetical protein IGI04_002153 [Brassica rapa subsp. trilocularis]|uniref:Uncharacterized protein n=1 Tax=Brassica rapa subsp. trilocularis TaxID=1813537 RepID=A0ABQ7NUR2_BRACM|nr:hypothetical protein IGI04_002153 [Brassica rapa subsp. trilocularis]